MEVSHSIELIFVDFRYSRGGRGGRGGRGRGGRGRGGRGRGRGKGPAPTIEELDAELDAYNKQVSDHIKVYIVGFIYGCIDAG